MKDERHKGQNETQWKQFHVWKYAQIEYYFIINNITHQKREYV